MVHKNGSAPRCSLNHATHAVVAVSISCLEAQARPLARMSSALYRPMVLSINALSCEMPTRAMLLAMP